MTTRTLPPFKVRENKLRRIARRQGFELSKSRVRDPRAIGYGGWRIANMKTGMIEAGADRALTADEVEQFLISGGLEEGDPSFTELVETERLNEKTPVIPIGPRTVIALTKDGKAYKYDINEEIWEGVRVINYAIRLTRKTRWQDDFEKMACDPETWQNYADAKDRAMQVHHAIEQILSDGRSDGPHLSARPHPLAVPLPPGVDPSYVERLHEKLVKALDDMEKAYYPVGVIVNNWPTEEQKTPDEPQPDKTLDEILADMKKTEDLDNRYVRQKLQ